MIKTTITSKKAENGLLRAFFGFMSYYAKAERIADRNLGRKKASTRTNIYVHGHVCEERETETETEKEKKKE